MVQQLVVYTALRAAAIISISPATVCRHYYRGPPIKFPLRSFYSVRMHSL